MARQLFFTHPVASTAQTSLGTAAFLLCAFALFMCASHSRRWRRWCRCFGCSSDNPVIQLNSEGTILTTKRVYGIEESLAGEQDISVWQRNILMGGKCQLPDFSGVIVYDSAGNIVVPPAKTSHVALSLK